MEIKMPGMNIAELMSKVGNSLREMNVSPDIRMTITQMNGLEGGGDPYVMVSLKFSEVKD